MCAMSSSDGPRFSCAACGKSYRWKAEIAGRSAKCACGAKLVVPSNAPSISDTEEVPLAPEPTRSATPQGVKPSQTSGIETKCPSCSASLVSGAVLCVNCGYNLKTGKKLGSVVVEADAEEESDEQAAEAEERT